MTTTTTLKDYPIIELDIDDIKKDPTNPNVMTLEQSRGLEKSMMNFGRLKHIVVDQNNILIDGEHRLEVEKAIGTQRVNVIQVTVKDEIERKMMRETLNKLHGEYDKQKESSELLAIFENNRLDEVAELLAQPKQNLENLISRYNPHIKFEREEDEAKLPSLYDTKSFVKRGEIWKLGRHILMCGDSTNPDDISKLMNDDNNNDNNKFADLSFIDPPYNVKFKYHNDDRNDNISKNEYTLFIESIFKNIKSVSKRQVVTPSTTNIGIWQELIEDFYDYGSWLKTNSVTYAKLFYIRRIEPILFYGDFSDVDRISNDVYEFAATTGFMTDKSLKRLEKDYGITEENHAPSKPVKLLVQLIKDFSHENQIVLDPCLGTGTTLIACEQTNRKCYGIEIDEHYSSVIIKRWELFTGEKAVKVSG